MEGAQYRHLPPWCDSAEEKARTDALLNDYVPPLQPSVVESKQVFVGFEGAIWNSSHLLYAPGYLIKSLQALGLVREDQDATNELR